jgi:hypothetical protein
VPPAKTTSHEGNRTAKTNAAATMRGNRLMFMMRLEVAWKAARIGAQTIQTETRETSLIVSHPPRNAIVDTKKNTIA